MANSCTFQMELIGSENQINHFIETLDNGKHRINDYNVLSKEFLTKDATKVRLQGLCDWNIAKSMLSEKPDYLNLVRASEEGQFSVEIFTEEDGHVMNPQTPTKQFSKFLKRHGIRHLKFHGLRHTSATMLLASGCDIKTVSSRLGHSGIDTTNIYVHALESSDRLAAKTFDAFLAQRNS